MLRMDLPISPPTKEKPRFVSKKRIAIAAAVLASLIILAGFVFNRQIESAGYSLAGKIFPGSHVKVKGTEVKGIADGKKVDHLAGTVKVIEPSTSGTRLTIEWEGDEKVILVAPNPSVSFWQSSGLTKGDIKEIKVGDYVMLDLPRERPNSNEESTRIVIVIW